MSIVDDFLDRYHREYDFYSESAKLCAEMCETQLENSGIRAIVTFRAKRPDRLKAKVVERNKDRGYRSVDAIYEDIVDMAGVRIALYFPGDSEEVGQIIESRFSVNEKRTFPDDAKKPPYSKRFSGYAANHYRVNIQANSLPANEARYSVASIEIQVASVLIHAWSEVEHDLVYKPLSGSVSEDEYAILDELNGLVLAGEIALERLQKLGEQRLSVEGTKFRNHYELASYLYSKIADSEIEMGRADVLFNFLQLIDKDKPAEIDNYLEEIDVKSSKWPVADQIVDPIIAGDEKLYNSYAAAREIAGPRSPYSTKEMFNYGSEYQESLGYFMSQWIMLEQELRSRAIEEDPSGSTTYRPARISYEYLPEGRRSELKYIRRLRNEVVHGVEKASPEQLSAAGRALESILSEM